MPTKFALRIIDSALAVVQRVIPTSHFRRGRRRIDFIYFDEEMGDVLTEALDGFAGDAISCLPSSRSAWSQSPRSRPGFFTAFKINLVCATSDFLLACRAHYRQARVTVEAGGHAAVPNSRIAARLTRSLTR